MPETLNPVAQVRAASARLSAAAESAIAKMQQPEVAGALYQFPHRESQNFSLVAGGWVETFPGVRAMLIDDVKHCGGCPAAKVCPQTTRVLMEVEKKLELPLHFHPFHETIHIVHGSIEDLANPGSLRRRATDILHFPALVQHQPVMQGLFMVCWSPPLTRTPVPVI